MKNILILLSVLWLTGCKIGENYCAKYHAPNISDSVTTEIKYVHDTAVVNVPYQDLSFDTSFSVNNGIDPSFLFHHEVKKDRLKGSIDIRNGKLTFKCEADSLRMVIDILKKEITVTDHQVKTVPVYCNLKHMKPIDYFCRWFTILSLIALVLRFVIKYFTGK